MPNNKMMWKVCGMRELSNIRQVAMLRPDFMGFIFYPPSPRYVGEDFPQANTIHLGETKTVGVFVNQSTAEIRDKIDRYKLDYVQLHGDESLEQVKELSRYAGVIKVISGNDLPSRETLQPYEPFLSYWLIDTRTAKQHGGTGQRFDWKVLEGLNLTREILLSGGIGVEEAAEAARLEADGVVGIDVNSKAEDAPGLKNIDTLKKIYNELHG